MEITGSLDFKTTLAGRSYFAAARTSNFPSRGRGGGSGYQACWASFTVLVSIEL